MTVLRFNLNAARSTLAPEMVAPFDIAALSAVMFARGRPPSGRMTQPDVCCDLVWVDDRLHLCGPLTRATLSQNVGREIQILNLDPLFARAWLGIPLGELTDRRIPLDEIAPRAAGPLSELFHGGRAAATVRPLDSAALFRLDPRSATAAFALRRTASVQDAAARAELSGRQLERMFHDRFGLRPKQYAIILRLRRAVAAAKKGEGIAGAAVSAGYVDQAHFHRDVRLLSGLTPGALLPHVGNSQFIVARTRDY
jgi:AraC-like DNA-binding protein